MFLTSYNQLCRKRIPLVRMIQTFLSSNNITIHNHDASQIKHVTSIAESNFDPMIINYLNKLGIVHPTPIQAIGWPMFMEGRDLVGVAETGSGKTFSFILPILTKLREKSGTGKPRALILSPTRELSIQTCSVLEPIARVMGIRSVSITSGQSMVQQQFALNKGVDVVIGTPGRLLALIDSNYLDLNEIEFVVLDEADRMLDMGFKDQLDAIMKHTKDTQTVMWSATWPKEVESLSLEYLKNPVRVVVGNEQLTVNKRIEQQFVFCPENEKVERLMDYIKDIGFKKSYKPGEEIPYTILFVNTKMMASEISRSLREAGFPAVELHGGLTKSRRDYNMESFKRGYNPILVATDVAARGVDVKGVKCVINYDFPTCIEDYVHRIGRTARGKDATGISYSFFTPSNHGLARDLKNLLQSAGIEVPQEVEQIQSRSGFVSGGFNRFAKRDDNFGKRNFDNGLFGGFGSNNNNYGNRNNNGYNNRGSSGYNNGGNSGYNNRGNSYSSGGNSYSSGGNTGYNNRNNNGFGGNNNNAFGFNNNNKRTFSNNGADSPRSSFKSEYGRSSNYMKKKDKNDDFSSMFD